MKIRHTLLSGWLLICLLLAGQFTLLVHETDHSSLPVSAPCVFCLSHSTFDGGAPATVIATMVDRTAIGVTGYQTPARPDLHPFTASKPRAPPYYS